MHQSFVRVLCRLAKHVIIAANYGLWPQFHVEVLASIIVLETDAVLACRLIFIWLLWVAVDHIDLLGNILPFLVDVLLRIVEAWLE